MTDDPLRSFRGIWLAMWLGLIMWVVIGCAITPVGGYAKYRLQHCEAIGCTNLNVNAHHILPQVDYPEYADGQGGTNIITLCAFHHRSWAHYGDTTKYYNVKIRKMVDDYNSGKRTYKEAK